MQHELGSGSSRYRRYVSRSTRTENFLSQNFFQVFLKTTFFHDSCYPVHYKLKIFFRFFKSALTPRYSILDSRFPPVMRSRKAGFPFATRARKRELSIHNSGLEVSPRLCDLGRQASPLQHELGSGSSRYRRYVSRSTRTENFLSQNFFQVFLKTTFSHISCYPVHYKLKIFFRFLKSALSPRYSILDSRFPPGNAISEGRPPLCNTSLEAGALDTQFWTRGFPRLCDLRRQASPLQHELGSGSSR